MFFFCTKQIKFFLSSSALFYPAASFRPARSDIRGLESSHHLPVYAISPFPFLNFLIATGRPLHRTILRVDIYLFMKNNNDSNKNR